MTRTPALRALFVALCALLVLSLSACGKQELHSGLTETEANEIVAALTTAGIESSKTPGDKDTFSVGVANGDFSRAVEVLRANGLPRERFDTLGTVFKQEGYSQTEMSQRVRLTYALSQELGNTISQIDGVISARVHLTMPEEVDPLTKETAPTSASVFVKYRQGFDVTNQTGAIKQLVTNGVDGLSYDRVSVIMSPSRAAAAPPKASVGSTILTILSWIVGAVALGVGAFVAWRWWQRRAKARAMAAPSASTELVDRP